MGKVQQEQSRLAQEKRNRRQAAFMSGTLFAAVLGLCFFLTAFTIQDPPPGEQFVSVGFADLGNTDQASGDTENEVPSEIEEETEAETEAVPEPQVSEVESVEDVVTEESSEVAVNQELEPEPEPEPEPVLNDRLAKLLNQQSNPKSGGGGSQGQTEGTGNEGDETGTLGRQGVVSQDAGEGLIGGGAMLGEPVLDEQPKEEGSVRIKIVVDALGNVTSAIAVYQSALTTLTDSKHIELAKRAAQTAKFEPNSLHPRRTGYITIRFDLE